MKKKYRIIITVTGEAPLVEAESLTEAEDKFIVGATREDLLEPLKIGAEEYERKI